MSRMEFPHEVDIKNKYQGMWLKREYAAWSGTLATNLVGTGSLVQCTYSMKSEATGTAVMETL